MNFPPIVCFSGIDWDFLWQRHQIFMSAFAARGIPVLFIENMGLRSPGVRDIGRIGQRIVNVAKQCLNGVRKEGPVTIFSPFVLPFDSKWAWLLNSKILLPLMVRRIHKLGFLSPIVWTYSPTKLAAHLADCLEPIVRVYDCVMSMKGYAYVTPQLLQSEQNWLLSSDLVLTDAQTLFEEKQVFNPYTYRIPPGVDFEHFVYNSSVPEPGDLSFIPRPRLCFFGTLGWWVDYEVLRNFAVHHKDWSVILIGPIKSDVSQIEGLDNVFCLGAKSHANLPDYLHYMDVLCIPYLVNDFTNGVLPSKLYESLATGKPVVATPITELLPYDGLIRIVKRKKFSETVITAHSDDSLIQSENRIRIASENSWCSRIDLAFELLESTLLRKDLVLEAYTQ